MVFIIRNYIETTFDKLFTLLSPMSLTRYSEVDQFRYQFQYADFKILLADFAPTVFKVANEVSKNPKIAKYLETDGEKPFTGLNLLGWL